MAGVGTNLFGTVGGPMVPSQPSSSGLSTRTGGSSYTSPVSTDEFTALADSIKTDYASSLENNAQLFSDLKTQIDGFEVQISEALATNLEVGQKSYDKMEFDLRQQLTNINNSQNVQVTRAASQLDSMVSGGQFGGNVYRAQQVYSQNVTAVIASSMKNMADITLAYRGAAEQLKQGYSGQQLQGYLSGAQMIIGATVDIAKSEALIQVDLVKSKNAALINVYNTIANISLSNMQVRSAEKMQEKTIAAQKWQTSYQASNAWEMQSRQLANDRAKAEMSNRQFYTNDATANRKIASYDAYTQGIIDIKSKTLEVGEAQGQAIDDFYSSKTASGMREFEAIFGKNTEVGNLFFPNS